MIDLRQYKVIARKCPACGSEPMWQKIYYPVLFCPKCKKITDSVTQPVHPNSNTTNF